MKPHLQALIETSFFLQLMDLVGITHRRCRNLSVLRTALVGTDRKILDASEALTDCGFVVKGFFGGDTNDRFHPSRPWSEFRAADFDIVLLAPRSPAEYDQLAPGLLEHYLNQPHPDCPLLHIPGMRDGFWSALNSLSSLPSCLNVRKLCVIASLLAQTKGGTVVECGSYQGGTALLMGALLRQWQDSRNVHAFDTFEGMPAPAAKDGSTIYVAGLFTETSQQKVIDLMAAHGLSSRVQIHKGLVQDKLPGALPADESISFALVDTDQYLGTSECLKQIVPRLATNGLIVVDDYGLSGVQLAVAEACALFPDLKGALLSENFYVLWSGRDEHFLSNTSA